jgi:hypothetical protein
MTVRDIGGIILLVVLMGALIFASIVGPSLRWKMNYGFGPEWDCYTPGPTSALSCIKRIRPPDSK